MNQLQDLSVRKLHPSLGAEVRGVDFREPLGRDVVDAIKAAWIEHLVLVFPEQPLTDEQHVTATRHFGEPEVFHQKILKSTQVREIFRVSNTDEGGNVMPQDHPTMRQISSAKQWHTDSSYRAVPAMGSLLHGIRVAREGGLTCFANMYAAYDTLPDALKAKVEQRTACHDFERLSHTLGAAPPTPEERAAMPPVWQPMVRRHPVSGRKSLYISPIYNDHVEGLGDDESRELIQALTEHATRDELVFKHKWTDDDIVMWDNRCTMHLVTDYDHNVPRIMHRTTIVGEEEVIAA